MIVYLREERLIMPEDVEKMMQGMSSRFHDRSLTDPSPCEH